MAKLMTKYLRVINLREELTEMKTFGIDLWQLLNNFLQPFLSSARSSRNKCRMVHKSKSIALKAKANYNSSEVSLGKNMAKKLRAGYLNEV